jgi:ligand-binding SRPBCC domain-containing protein
VPTFVRQVLVNAPVDVVFAFHEREDALPLLSPAFPPVRVVERTGGIEPGARVELRIGGLVRWIARHTAFERNRLFVDEQIEGPFRRWVHRHEFEPAGDATRLTDRITYEVPGGPFVNRAAAWLLTPGLWQMFRHRHRVTKTWCERR